LDVQPTARNFFISYSKADLPWAEWIAWQLEAEGYTTTVQAWDFRPGSNFVHDMQRAAAEAERTIAVLSPDYLASLYTQPEWAAAFAQDPTGEKGPLLPVRVGEARLTGRKGRISARWMAPSQWWQRRPSRVASPRCWGAEVTLK
jgi:hypothetical protein